MTGAEFSAALNRLGLTVGEFRRLTGASAKKVEQWLSGEEAIPPYVPSFLALLGLPKGIETAKAVAASRLLPD
jgi:hypothetical protein